MGCHADRCSPPGSTPVASFCPSPSQQPFHPAYQGVCILAQKIILQLTPFLFQKWYLFLLLQYINIYLSTTILYFHPFSLYIPHLPYLLPLNFPLSIICPLPSVFIHKFPTFCSFPFSFSLGSQQPIPPPPQGNLISNKCTPCPAQNDIFNVRLGTVVSQ